MCHSRLSNHFGDKLKVIFEKAKIAITFLTENIYLPVVSEVDHKDTVNPIMTNTKIKQTAIKLYFFFFVLMRLLNNWINLFLMFCIESLIKSQIFFHNPVKHFEIEF